MATTEVMSNAQSVASDSVDDDFNYRSLSSGAIASVVLGVLSSLLFVAGGDSLLSCMLLSPIPVVGLTIGLRALASIHAMPDQLSGKKTALVGVVLSIVGLVGGIGYAGLVHATEVPEGYTRTAFYEFRPDEVEQRVGKLVPPDVHALDGEKVFIKGYMRPGTHVSRTDTPVRHNVSRFLLVRDNNQCCFGDISTVKYYDQVFVQLADRLTTEYSGRMFRIGGVLKIFPENAASGARLPVYTLQADYVK